jgi:hypothetical protein
VDSGNAESCSPVIPDDNFGIDVVGNGAAILDDLRQITHKISKLSSSSTPSLLLPSTVSELKEQC